MNKKTFLVSRVLTAILVLGVIPAQADDTSPSAATVYMWQLINEVRVAPRSAITRFNLNEDEVRKVLADNAWILDQGLPPLAWNDSLFSAASRHCSDMAQGHFCESMGSDGTMPIDRIHEAGYRAASNDELLGALAFECYVDDQAAARFFVERWVIAELTGKSPLRIFEPGFSEVGMALDGTVLDVATRQMNSYLAVAEFAAPETPRVFVMGNVVRPDQASVWDSAEAGVAGMPLIFVNLDTLVDTYTVSGPSGTFQFQIPQGYSGVILRDHEDRDLDKRLLENRGNNIWLQLFIR